MGSRVKRYHIRGIGYGRLGPGKISILRTHVTSFLSVIAYDPSVTDDPEDETILESEKGITFMLNIAVPGARRPLKWNISNMTTEELEVTRQFFNHLFDLAEPVVKARDKAAQDAFDQGDDTYSRIYRSLPQFIIREGAERAHREGLLNGLKSPLAGDEDGFDPRSRVRADGNELADSQSESSDSQDDGEETN